MDVNVHVRVYGRSIYINTVYIRLYKEYGYVRADLA